MQKHDRLILRTGATVYIGGRLLSRLENQGARMRCVARHPENLRGRTASDTEVVAGGVFNVDSLHAALQGVDTAFFLVHSMSDAKGFVAGDRKAANNFATAARACDVRRVICLGGLGESGHLWRVEAFEPDRLLRLRAQMKLPGRAWLQFELQLDGNGSQIRQTAMFDPRGLFGILYWYGLYVVHSFIFSGMLRNIARATTKPTTGMTPRHQSTRPHHLEGLQRP